MASYDSNNANILNIKIMINVMREKPKELKPKYIICTMNIHANELT